MLPDGFEPFLETVLDSPHDDGPRMVFADWLEEHDDQRGEFIRVQLEMARRAADDSERDRLSDRESDLLTRFGAGWRAEIPEWARDGCEFRRGFVTEVNIFRPWERHFGPELSRLAPVERVTLHHANGAMEEFAAHPHVRHLRELAILDTEMGPDDLKPLCHSQAAVERLTSLQFFGMGLLDAGALLISLCPHLSKLARLELKRCQIAARGVHVLAATHHLPALDWLDLSENELGNDALWYLANSPLMTHVARLHWNDNTLTGDASDGARILTEAKSLCRLTHLELAGNHITDHGARLLREHFADLHYLDLSRNPLTDGMKLELKQQFGPRVHVGMRGE